MHMDIVENHRESIHRYGYIYIIYPAHIEYRIEILASQGIPIIELENIYLEYSWRQKTYT